MPIKNAIHSQQVYDPTDESIMAEQELCMERLDIECIICPETRKPSYRIYSICRSLVFMPIFS